jgi:membrane-associated phospholipid phosphatase
MNLLAFALPLVLFLVLWMVFYYPLAGAAIGAKALVKLGSARLARTRLARWATGYSGWSGLRSYAPILLVLGLGGIAALGAGYLFLELALHFRLTTSPIYRVDQAAQAWFQHLRSPGLTALFRTMTLIGGAISISSVVAVLVALLLVWKERASALYLVLTAVGGILLNTGLKLIFARARPALTSAIAVARWYAFPSGHAMESIVVFGAMAYLALRQPWRWRVKSACLAAACTLVALIGVSRVYLGVHWLSDIAGGWTAAMVWLAAATVAFDMLLRLRQRRREVQPSSPAVDVPDVPLPPRTAPA